MIPNPEMVDNILNVINNSQADIRQVYLESQRAQASRTEQGHTSPFELPRPAVVPVPSTPVTAYEPMPMPTHMWGSGRHQGSRSTLSYHEDSGYHTRASILTHSDE